MDVECRENEQDVSTDLRTRQSRWHHDCGKTVVENVHVRLFRVSRFKIVEKPHRRANKDRKTGNRHSRFRIKLEKCNKHRYGDPSAADASHRAKRHNKSEDKQTDDFKRFLGEDVLVHALLIIVADEIGIIGAIGAHFTFVYVFASSSNITLIFRNLGRLRQNSCKA